MNNLGRTPIQAISVSKYFCLKSSFNTLFHFIALSKTTSFSIGLLFAMYPAFMYYLRLIQLQENTYKDISKVVTIGPPGPAYSDGDIKSTTLYKPNFFSEKSRNQLKFLYQSQQEHLWLPLLIDPPLEQHSLERNSQVLTSLWEWEKKIRYPMFEFSVGLPKRQHSVSLASKQSKSLAYVRCLGENAKNKTLKKMYCVGRLLFRRNCSVTYRSRYSLVAFPLCVGNEKGGTHVRNPSFGEAFPMDQFMYRST